MKAARLYGIGDIRIDEVPRPSPGPGEALVRVKAVGICGSDVHYFKEGRIGEVVVSEPLVLGHEPAGVVEAVGEGVEHLKPGDRVAVDPAIPCGRCEWCERGHPNLCPSVRFFGTPPVDGALREYITHPAEALFKLPEGLDYECGAMLEPFGVALHAVDLAHLKPGQRIAVFGVGVIGLFVVQLARLSGAVRIFATDLFPSRLELAGRFGADEVFRPDLEDPVAGIMEATGGRGVDVAFEAAWVHGTVEQAVEALAPGGTLVLIGIPLGEDVVSFRASSSRRKGLTVKMVRRMKHAYPRAIRMAEKGLVDLKSPITHRFPLEEVQRAFETAAECRDGVVKVMVEFINQRS